MKIAWGCVFALLVACSKKENEKPIAMTVEDGGGPPFAVEKPKKGYTPTTKEVVLLKAVVDDEVTTMSEGGSAMIGDLTSVTSLALAKAYEANQVAADQKYAGKTLLVTGKVTAILSGLGNVPYLKLEGSNRFQGPHVNFAEGNTDRIATLSKGDTVHLTCVGGGSVVGTAALKGCQFSDERAKVEGQKLRAEVAKYLAGEQTPSTEVILIVTMALSYARALPANSICFSDSTTCMKSVGKLKKGEGENEMSLVQKDLREAGLETL